MLNDAVVATVAVPVMLPFALKVKPAGNVPETFVMFYGVTPHFA
jgi:hypothetical protein